MVKRKTIFIDNMELRAFDDYYYVSRYGDIYSIYSNKFLKHAMDHDGYHRVDIHQKHYKIHKLVYICWGEKELNNNYQINHIDDDKNNNCIDNLYLGTQKENIQDCINNNHRKGNNKEIYIFDKLTETHLYFPSYKKFLEYADHPIKSSSLKKFINREWFKKRYTIEKV